MDKSGNLKPDFVVRESDLTNEGLELFKKAIPAWFAGLDRGKNVDDTSSLKNALTKITGTPQR